MIEFYIGLTLFGILISMMLSASEASIFSLSRIDLASLQNLGLKEKYLKIIKKPEELLITLLVGNELADYFASFFFATIITLLFHEEYRSLGFLIFGLLTFWLGDFFPKVLGFKLREKLVLIILPFTYFIYQILFPLRNILYNLYLKIYNFFPEIKEKKDLKSFTPVEQIIMHALDLALKEKKITPTEREFVFGLFLSEKIPVSAIMTPRSEIVALKDQPLTLEIMERIRALPFNKIPIYQNTLDEIVGILYVKDLIRHFGKNSSFNLKNLSDLTKPAFFVPENFKVRNLLFEFQKRHLKIALVVDEYGILKGLITLEDILEELFGEFFTEREEPHEPIQKISENYFLLSGKALLEEAKEVLEIPFELEVIEDLKTVNGFMLSLFQGIPKEGEKINYLDWEFIIRKTKGRKILLVEAKKVKNA
ncbi:MAG: hemolysin family protein [Caldimicrobium thiodismutans]